MATKKIGTKDLLGVERIQKLDLMAHLIANLRNTLILQGSKGIGKTTLLTAALSREISDTDMLLLNATHNLSFESIQYELVEFINEKYQLDGRALSDILASYDKQDRKLVVLIDDAGLLLTGLMNALINYANKHPALRIVFALTPEEFELKHEIEGLNRHCHFIELLELNYEQSEVFIRQLVDVGQTQYVDKDITTHLLKDIYQAAKGNPSEISRIMMAAKKGGISSTMLLFLLIMLIAVISATVSFFLWDEPLNPVKTAEEIVLVEPAIVTAPPLKINESIKSGFADRLKQIQTSESGSPATAISPVLKKAVPPVIPEIILPIKREVIKPTVKPIEPIAVSKPVIVEPLPVLKAKDESPQAVLESLLIPEKSVSDIKSVKPLPVALSGDDTQWVLQQDSQQYTLQLMALSEKGMVKRTQEKYKALGYRTFYLQKKKANKVSYLLFYGGFSDMDKTRAAMQKLPEPLRKSWPRPFADIQKELKQSR